jgi:hypothetical protein
LRALGRGLQAHNPSRVGMAPLAERNWYRYCVFVKSGLLPICPSLVRDSDNDCLAVGRTMPRPVNFTRTASPHTPRRDPSNDHKT